MADNPLGSKKTFSFLVVGFAGLAASANVLKTLLQNLFELIAAATL